jgi:lipopolysaccharide biosynthesis regulator YciM
MGAAFVLLLVGLGALAAGVLIGRYYVPDDRALRRTARHSRAYMRALNHLIARDHETVVKELRSVVEENIEEVEPYFALGAMFRSRGEHERAIRVHQALALRERDRRKLRTRAMYELGMDFRAAGMPRRATRAMEEVLLEEPGHEGALRALASLYEEQARFHEAAGMWQRLGRRRGEDTSAREHHLLVAAAQAALGRDDPESAKHLLKAAQKHAETAHYFAASAELAATRGNYRGARERLRQTLLADPGLAPHILPGLIAAESELVGQEVEGGAAAPVAGNDDELDHAAAQAPPPIVPAGAEPPRLLAGAAGRPPVPPVAERVLALLTEIEAQTGPRLELALIRAQLAKGRATQDGLAKELVARFPDALAARVATARIALENGEGIEEALGRIAGEHGMLAWALQGRWQCSHCGNRPGPFGWRCAQCRRWGTLRMETGIEPPPIAPRDRRSTPRSARPEGLLGISSDGVLPSPTLDHGLTEEELARAGTRRSLLGRVGGWVSGVWRRNP